MKNQLIRGTKRPKKTQIVGKTEWTSAVKMTKQRLETDHMTGNMTRNAVKWAPGGSQRGPETNTTPVPGTTPVWGGFWCDNCVGCWRRSDLLTWPRVASRCLGRRSRAQDHVSKRVVIVGAKNPPLGPSVYCWAAAAPSTTFLRAPAVPGSAPRPRSPRRRRHSSAAAPMRGPRRRQAPEKRAFLAEFGAGGRGEIAITVRGWRYWMDDSEWATDAPSHHPATQLVRSDDAQVARTWRCCWFEQFCEFYIVTRSLTHILA